jgi:hypothetical protein
MADTKITALTAISTVDPAVDVLPIVDVSDTTMAASGTTKKITSNQILGAGGTATLASATITGAATVGTTFGVTGASTFTGAATFNGAATLNGNTTLGDAQTDTSTINAQLTARQGEFPSAVRAAASDYAAVTFDGATALTRITSGCQSIGTGDFSIWVRARIPTTNPSASFIYAAIGNSSASGFDSTGSFIISQEAGGAIQVSGYVAGVFTIAMAVNGLVANYGGQIVDIVLTRVTSGGTTTATLYINGASVATSTAAVVATSVTSNYFHVGASAGGQCNTRIFRSVVFNRALSAADVVELITIGVNPADQWGTQTQVVGFNPAVLNGGFETNSLNASGTWSVVVPSGTGTGTIDTSGSFSLTGTNAGKLTLDASANNVFFSSNNGSLSTLVAGKRYRISIWGRKGAISGNCGFQFGNGAASAAYGSSGLTLTTAYSQSLVEIVAVTDGSFVIARQAGSAALSEIYIDDVEITRIGAIVDLDFTVGTGYQATDRSTNSLHGTLFNGVSFTDTKKVAVVYATTNTNGNQQMLGTLAIPTNAIIEDIIVNSTGSATVSVGNASAGTQIVNGASVVSGRQKLTLATPFSTTGNLWVNSNTTDTLQFTILYTIAS